MKPEEFREKYGYSLEDLDQLRDEFKTQRARKERLWKMLDAYDSGEFWETLRSKLPKHQIIPDTNYVFYVKDNIVNSTFSAPYIADVLPIDPGDTDETGRINKFISYEYNRMKLGYKQLQAGTRAALLNVGFIQCGWDKDSKFTVNGNTNTGQMDFTHRDPMSVLLDSNYDDFYEGRAVFILTEDSYENTVANYPNAKDELDESLKPSDDEKNHSNVLPYHSQNTKSQSDVGKGYFNKGVTPMTKGMIPIYIAYKKQAKENGGYRIDQIIYTDQLVVLEEKKGIKPNYFPIVALYNSPPEKDGYGTGVTERILRNALSLNVLDSISVTHTYAAQRTPWVLDTNSGLSPARVSKDLNKPDRVFLVNNADPEKALRRLEYPELPRNLEYIKSSLEESIKRISGVDEKYTGRDSASVSTTGGMERLQSRVSMSDNTRIAMIEKYAQDLTRMILDFYVEFGGKRTFATSKEYNSDQQETMEVDFNKYKESEESIHKFSYHINASPLLPKNRQRLAEAANTIMQVQMQYQGQIELLTPEEWLFFQDFPQKDMILDRMKLDRLRNDYEDIASEITSFQAMTEEGMRPEQAVDQLAKERSVQREPSVMKKQAQSKNSQ